MPVPELQRGFSSNGKESKSSVVDLTTLKTLSKLDTGQKSGRNRLRTAAREDLHFQSHWKFRDGDRREQAKIVATIPLGGSPEFAVRTLHRTRLLQYRR